MLLVTFMIHFRPARSAEYTVMTPGSVLSVFKKGMS